MEKYSSLTSYEEQTGDETWLSFVSVETKDQLKQWMHQ
jgi:hypothetical protein